MLTSLCQLDYRSLLHLQSVLSHGSKTFIHEKKIRHLILQKLLHNVIFLEKKMWI